MCGSRRWFNARTFLESALQLEVGPSKVAEGRKFNFVLLERGFFEERPRNVPLYLPVFIRMGFLL